MTLNVGDMVHVYASNHGKIANEKIFETIVFPHGTGPFAVVGVGPNKVALKIGRRNVNVPKEWVTRCRARQ